MDGQPGHLPSHPAAAADSGGGIGIGRPVARREDERLLRGGGHYVSGLIATSRALRVKVLRSPHPHARPLAGDATPARPPPGAAAVPPAGALAGTRAPA